MALALPTLSVPSCTRVVEVLKFDPPRTRVPAPDFTISPERPVFAWVEPIDAFSVRVVPAP